MFVQSHKNEDERPKVFSFYEVSKQILLRKQFKFVDGISAKNDEINVDGSIEMCTYLF